MGLFGNPAPLIVDINLIAQFLILILLVIGRLKKRPLKTHGTLMLAATALTLVTILLIMGPALVFGFGTYSPIILFHVGIGVLASLLGLVFSVRFTIAVRGGKPLRCGTKHMMRITLLIWLVSLIGGTSFYIARYVLLIL
jgi:uncharacterized membrane protein YozB (DUF420 family)